MNDDDDDLWEPPEFPWGIAVIVVFILIYFYG